MALLRDIHQPFLVILAELLEKDLPITKGYLLVFSYFGVPQMDAPSTTMRQNISRRIVFTDYSMTGMTTRFLHLIV